MKDLVFENVARALRMCTFLGTRSKPTSQSGTILQHLFDENASNHLAIGAAYDQRCWWKVGDERRELKLQGLTIQMFTWDFMIIQIKWTMVSVRIKHVPLFRRLGNLRSSCCWKYVCRSPYGTLGRCFNHRGEHGCFGKMFLGWIGCLLAPALELGVQTHGIAAAPAVLGCYELTEYFLWRRGS